MSESKPVVLEIADLLGERSIEAGFVWELGEVSYDPHKNRQKVSLGDDHPYVRVVDVVLFEANFPGVILESLDGTSIKVMCQAVTRRARLRNRQVTVAELRRLVINALKQIRNRPTAVVIHEKVRVWVVGGEEFDTLEAAQDAQREIYIDAGLDESTIEKLLAKMNA